MGNRGRAKKQFRYLEQIITEDLYCDQEISARIEFVKLAFRNK